MGNSESKETFTLHEMTVKWESATKMWILYDAAGRFLAKHATKKGIITRSRDYRG